MGKNNSYNILMYSHDTYGLGHIRRSLAIADHLRGPDVNVLILTGSPLAGRFKFPDRVDFVRIPGMIKKTNEEYLPLSIKINARHALDIRKQIITATAKTFRPNLFIVDKEPLGLKKEVLPTLEWIRKSLPNSKTILGLRDIMDDAESVQKDWEKKGVYDLLDSLYSEIWIYGLKDFYDPVKEYAIPQRINSKICFTGYIKRRVSPAHAKKKVRHELGLKNGEKLVVVTTGGGGDGYRLMENYLSMLESCSNPLPFKSFLVTGPFMPVKQRREIDQRVKRKGGMSVRFYARMEALLAAADLVVSMGGYNTICEILSQGTVSLIIPRETPRKEQLIRARVLSQRNLTDYIPWNEVTGEKLGERVFDLLDHPNIYRESIRNFRLTGIDTLRERLKACRGNGS